MNPPPSVPEIGALKPIAHVSASAADRLLSCPLRFALDHEPALQYRQPFVASALLGTAAHVVLAALIDARHAAERESSGLTRDVARDAFDNAVVAGCRRRDAVIAERGRLPGDCTDPATALPYYSITRARLGRVAVQRFGERWRWPVPRFDRHSSHAGREVRRRTRDVESELPLQTRDGVIRGSADAVDQSGRDVIIEEFKTGEATPERLKSWKRQLLIYAQLFREQYGRLPKTLRVHSLASGVQDLAYVEAEAVSATEMTRAALRDLNERIASGADPKDLARPSASSCRGCPHRAWCDSYWSAFAPGSNGADAEGTVAAVDGWEADLLRHAEHLTRVTFKGQPIALRAGIRLRICDARIGMDGKLACDRSTAVWRVGP